MLGDHAVVVGYGRVGRDVVVGLCGMGVPVVIDQDRRLVQAGGQGLSCHLRGCVIRERADLSPHRPCGLVVVALPAAVPTRTAVHEGPRAHVSVPILVRSTHPEDEQMLRRP
jgi:hypothetical protein